MFLKAAFGGGGSAGVAGVILFTWVVLFISLSVTHLIATMGNLLDCLRMIWL